MKEGKGKWSWKQINKLKAISKPAVKSIAGC